MTLRRLKLLARALFAPRGVERDLDDELAFHIERETQKQIADGISPAEARASARARFGSVTVAADDCRDERGTALAESVVRDVLYACRSFRRAPLAALTIVTTVALGLGLVAVVFTLLNAVIFRVDEVRNPHELFGVERQPSANANPESFRRSQYDALIHETDVFADAYAITNVDSRVDGRKLEGSLVTGNFFHVLGVSAARGRTLTPSDDELGGGQAIVVSHRAWSRHFGSDPDVISRVVLLNRVPFHIVGVMPEGFRGLTVHPPDFWAPLSLVGQFRHDAGRQDAVAVDIIGRLRPGLSRERAVAELQVWDSRRAVEGALERPGSNLALEPRQGTVPLSADVMLTFTPLFFAFGLILIIGCANVANLLLARAVARQREIGIRLAMGASRRRIVGQLLTESLLLALLSAALGFGISRLGLSVALYAVTVTWAPALGDIRLDMPPADWRVAVFLVAGAMVSTIFFALVPALQATRLDLVRAVRGEILRDARPGRARNVLLAVQVTAAVLLLTCSAVFLRSALSAATIDPGIRAADTVIVGIVDEQRRGALLEAVKSDPSVASVAASFPEVLGQSRAGLAEVPAPRPGVAEASASTNTAAGETTHTRGKSAIAYRFVSPEYFSVLGIEIVRGRGFIGTERSAGAGVAIVSESAARQLWPGLDPVGQILALEPDPESDTPRSDEPRLLSHAFDVVGVARDVAGFAFTKSKEAVVYVPVAADAARTSLTLRVHGDPDRARDTLVERLEAIDPNMSEVLTLRMITRMATYFLQLAFWLTLVLGALALLLTLSGLFSVLSYLVEQRTREIGVRMALGATSGRIGALVLSQSARPVGIGLLLGGSLTAALGAALLATPAADLIGSVVRLFDPVAYAASLLCIVMACACAALIPALRAGRVDPIAALRQD